MLGDNARLTTTRDSRIEDTLWYEKAWATIMVMGIVGITIPIEIFEIVHKASLIKFGVFAINVAMFIYLLRHAIEQHKSSPRDRA